MTLDTLPTFDFVVERGNSVTIELGPITVNGVAVDLTQAGTKMWLTVKRSYDDADPGEVQLIQGTGITLNDPVTADKNMATARIVETEFADPAAFPDRTKLVWDAVWELGARHETIARGQLIVVPSVTRAT